MFAVAIVYAVSRVMFLPLGYGLDDDAWLLARAADILANGGGYVASRLPGYPSVELIVGGLFCLFGTSAVLGNLSASLAGLALMFALWVVLDGEVSETMRLFAVCAVAFHPAVWTASVTTLDPIFGAAFLVLSVAAVSRRRPVLAGVFLGLAVGCRLTDALAALPIAFFARGKTGGWRTAAKTVVTGGIVGASLFVLPLLAHGIGFLDYEPVIHRDFVTGGYKVYRELIGLPLVVGSVMVAGAVVVSGERRRRTRDLIGEPLVVLGATAVVVLATPFVILPTDPQYLLPWVPFGVILLAGSVRRRVVRESWAIGLLAAAMAPAAIGIGLLDLDSWRSRHELRPVWIAPGQIPELYVERVTQIRHADTAAGFSYPVGSAVILGSPFMATQQALGVPERDLATYLYEAPERGLMLFRLLPPWYLDRVEGMSVWYAEGEALPYLTRRIFGYELDDLNAHPLEVWPVIDRRIGDSEKRGQ